MTRNVSAHLRLVGPAVFVAALALGSVPAAAQTAPTAISSSCSQLHFELANPSPGAMIEPGAYVLEGVAMDARSTSGPGVDRIDFFLGSRDEGGLSLGSTTPMSTGGPLGAGSFQTTLTLPDQTGTRDLFGYAHSTVTGQEAVIQVPIQVGVPEDTTVAGAQSAPTTLPSETETCTPAQGNVVSTAPAATTPSTTTTTPSTTTTTPSTTTTTTTATTPASNASINIQVANPDPSASIFSGAYEIEGRAWDAMAQQGTGVDRVEVFLDNRDEGGTTLGTALVGMANPAATQGTEMPANAWRIVVDLPSNQTGPHSLWFYAHSSVTGLEKAIEVPVTIVQ